MVGDIMDRLNTADKCRKRIKFVLGTNVWRNVRTFGENKMNNYGNANTQRSQQRGAQTIAYGRALTESDNGADVRL